MVEARSEFLIYFMESKTLVVAHARSYRVVADRHKSLLPSQSLETFVRVANEGQAHLSGMLIASLCSLCAQSVTVIVLVDFVYREVLCINVRLQLGLERSANTAKAVPLDATEEGMLLNLVSTVGATDST
jgi:hypothetical protein